MPSERLSASRTPWHTPLALAWINSVPHVAWSVCAPGDLAREGDLHPSPLPSSMIPPSPPEPFSDSLVRSKQSSVYLSGSSNRQTAVAGVVVPQLPRWGATRRGVVRTPVTVPKPDGAMFALRTLAARRSQGLHGNVLLSGAPGRGEGGGYIIIVSRVPSSGFSAQPVPPPSDLSSSSMSIISDAPPPAGCADDWSCPCCCPCCEDPSAPAPPRPEFAAPEVAG